MNSRLFALLDWNSSFSICGMRRTLKSEEHMLGCWCGWSWALTHPLTLFPLDNLVPPAYPPGELENLVAFFDQIRFPFLQCFHFLCEHLVAVFSGPAATSLHVVFASCSSTSYFDCAEQAQVYSGGEDPDEVDDMERRWNAALNEGQGEASFREVIERRHTQNSQQLVATAWNLCDGCSSGSCIGQGEVCIASSDWVQHSLLHDEGGRE